MTATVSRFGARLAPCGTSQDGESFVTEDHQGLITEELQFTADAASPRRSSTTGASTGWW